MRSYPPSADEGRSGKLQWEAWIAHRDPAGAPIAASVPVTAFLPLLGLPHAALVAIPYAPLGHSPTYSYTWASGGSTAVSIWDLLWAGAQEVLDKTWQYVASAVAFYVDAYAKLAESFVQLGLWVARTVKDAPAAVAAAVQEAQEGFEQMVGWIYEFAFALLDTTLGEAIRALKASFDAYTQAVLDTFLAVSQDLKDLGFVTTAKLNAAAHALQGSVYWALLGIAVGLYAAVIALAPFSFTVGAVAGGLALFVVAYLVHQFVLDSEGARDSGGPALSADTLLDQLVDVVQSWWERKTQLTDEDSRNFWTTVGWYLRWAGLMFGANVWGAYVSMTGAMDIPYGLLFGALALVLTFQVIQTTGTAAHVFSILTAFVGGLGMLFAGKFVLKNWASFIPALRLLGIVGLLLGGSAAVIGTVNLVI